MHGLPLSWQRQPIDAAPGWLTHQHHHHELLQPAAHPHTMAQPGRALPLPHRDYDLSSTAPPVRRFPQASRIACSSLDGDRPILVLPYFHGRASEIGEIFHRFQKPISPEITRITRRHGSQQHNRRRRGCCFCRLEGASVRPQRRTRPASSASPPSNERAQCHRLIGHAKL